MTGGRFFRLYAARAQALTQMLVMVWMFPTLPRLGRARLASALASTENQAAKYVAMRAHPDSAEATGQDKRR